MEANYALQTQHIHLAEGAYLEYLPEPMIPTAVRASSRTPPRRGVRGDRALLGDPGRGSVTVAAAVPPASKLRTRLFATTCFSWCAACAACAVSANGRELFTEVPDRARLGRSQTRTP